MGLAPSTTNAYMSHLSSVLTACVQQWEWLYQYPIFRIRRLSEPKGRARYLNDKERECLLHVCKHSRSPHLYVVVMLAIATGARYRELLRLRWADVDFERDVITFWRTKNGDIRTVPLVEVARKLLLTHEKSWGNSPFVFPSAQYQVTNINLQRPVSSLWRSWDLARNRARLDDLCAITG